MAITRYDFGGPGAAYGAFSPKAQASSGLPDTGSVFLSVLRDTTTGTDSVFLSASRGDTAGQSEFVDARRDS